jgi:hypothetical protein
MHGDFVYEKITCFVYYIGEWWVNLWCEKFGYRGLVRTLHFIHMQQSRLLLSQEIWELSRAWVAKAVYHLKRRVDIGLHMMQVSIIFTNLIFITVLHLSCRESISKLQLLFRCFGLGTLLFLVRESIILT